MTYQEQYSELHSNYVKAGKELENEIEKLSEINGFFDKEEIDNYFEAQKRFSYAEEQFQKFLNYIKNGKVDLNTEYIDKKYMYGYIKQDQIQNGTEWNDFESYPGEGRNGQYYSCNIGLTNIREIEEEYQTNQYKFPVLNLNHGKECYKFLSDKLMRNLKKDFDFNELNFSKIDQNRPIFMRISMRTK